jgi:hypothetical protein
VTNGFAFIINNMLSTGIRTDGNQNLRTSLDTINVLAQKLKKTLEELGERFVCRNWRKIY